MGLLAHEGLLRRGERGGYFVPELTQRDLREILQARAAVEAGAVRLTAEARPTSEQFKQLNDFCDQMQQMAEDGYEMGADEADRRFHQALVELSANRRLIRLYEHAPLPWMPSSLSDAAERTRETLDSVAEHRRLVELIQQGHLAEAVALIETHLSRIPDVRLTD
jgi:DNA-binding GntR family transcriptional regulator